MAASVKRGLDNAFEEMKRFNEMEIRQLSSQTPALPNYPQLSISISDDDDDVFMVEQPPIARGRQANAGSSSDRPVAVSSLSPRAPAPAPAPASSSISLGLSLQNAPKRRRVEVQDNSLKNSAWMNAHMSPKAISSK